jgi:hypothetical protein
MRRSHFAPAVLLFLFALASLGAESQPEIPAGEDFGAGLTLQQPVALAEVVSAPERFEEPVLLHGRLADVCQRKGCWTILRDGEAQVRVRFRDYGFFLPTDATGAEAFVEGVVKVEVLSEKVVRHYESEARDGDPDNVTGPRREVGFVASGVRLVGRD